MNKALEQIERFDSNRGKRQNVGTSLNLYKQDTDFT